MRATGEWISTAPVGHQCAPPAVLFWRARVGARWQCECGVVWRLGRRASETYSIISRSWFQEKPPGGLQVFREADDAAVQYWLAEELGSLHVQFPAEAVLTALRKHFTIGVQS